MMTFVFWGVLIVGGVVAFVLEERRQDIKDAEETIEYLIHTHGMTREEAIMQFNIFNGEQ